MSRALHGGRVEDLADQGDLTVLTQGAKLLVSGTNLSGLGSNIFGKKKEVEVEEDDGDGFEEDIDYDDQYDEMLSDPVRAGGRIHIHQRVPS